MRVCATPRRAPPDRVCLNSPTLHLHHSAHPLSPLTHTWTTCRAYNLDDAKSTVGNDFMNAIQPFVARRPLLGSPGNHEVS
jgi:hypothetical protein